VLNEATSKAAYQLEGAARALKKLPAGALAEGLEVLEAGPEAAADAPAQLFGALVAVRRVHALLAGGAREAAEGG
jgi:hypothetical protein